MTVFTVRDKKDSLQSDDWEVVHSPSKRNGTAAQTSNKSISAMKEETRQYTIITTSLLIPGAGTPIKNAVLVIEDKLIAWVGRLSELPKKFSETSHRSVSVPYLMPGLWDSHVHFAAIPDDATSNAAMLITHPAEQGARLAKGCWQWLQWGYTSVRDMGGFGCEVARAIDDGSIVGPNIYSSGGGLTQIGGHGDYHDLPAGMIMKNMSVANILPGHYGTECFTVADGIEECRRAVRLNIRRGARCIKVIASGGVGSLNDDVSCAQYSSEELRCIVEEASRQNIAVGAHAHAKAGIVAAVNAGVTTIEHGSFADRETLEVIKNKGVVLIATRTITELLMSTRGEGLPQQIWEKINLVATANRDSYAMAVKMGLKIALGTDRTPGFSSSKELEYAVDAGMSNLEAIEAATANGPLTVGLKAPKSGQLKVGYEADIIGLQENPVDDVKILQNIDNIKWVWKAGLAFKGPGIGPWGEEL
ncbi:amidohydrolase [Truncatella angustata]|uniref:Amidohydrolase n=1 Tax=Truncatella angustata TaxID=152316 RepID=A0A9P8ZYB5_9PEZI|nr:amidohydrolase [Truncatella angustata]KAH6655866.1 amidohydrolase [Truncatella angustata]KAH8202947.1 hypothetical protein TruAng_002893 [Truncatella angustata]